jgi:hypothetical protein
MIRIPEIIYMVVMCGIVLPFIWKFIFHESNIFMEVLIAVLLSPIFTKIWDAFFSHVAETSPLKLAERKIKSSWLAGLVMVLISLVYLLMNFSEIESPGINVLILGFDNFLFLGLNYGAYRKSRTFAVLALLYYVAGKALVSYNLGRIEMLPVILIFVYFFTQGVIGNFQYNRLIKNYKMV